MRPTLLLWTALTCVACVVCSQPARLTSPQPIVFSAARGTLVIDLRTPENAHVTDARVLLMRAPAVFESEQTDSGMYAFAEVPTGAYMLRIARIGYRTVAESITVQPANMQRLRRELQVFSGCDIDCGVVHPVNQPVEEPWWRRWHP